MPRYKKRKQRTLADKVLYRIHMIRSWRNYDFYFSESHNYQNSFRHDYLDDYDSFCRSGGSLRSFLVSDNKEENFVRKIFGEENGFPFRRECLERIKKSRKHGKAKLLVGHLFDDKEKGKSHIILDNGPNRPTRNVSAVNDARFADIVKELEVIYVRLGKENGCGNG